MLRLVHPNGCCVLQCLHWKALANYLVTTVLHDYPSHANSINAVVVNIYWEASDLYTRAVQIQSELMPE